MTQKNVKEKLITGFDIFSNQADRAKFYKLKKENKHADPYIFLITFPSATDINWLETCYEKGVYISRRFW